MHQYCSYCCLHLSDTDLENDPNIQCRRSISQDSGLSHLIEIPIADKIQSFFARHSFLEDIKYRFNMGKKTGAIEDIMMNMCISHYFRMDF